MPKIMTSREFNQDISLAKRLSSEGPVIITDRGRPAHVLLTIADYTKLSGGKRTLAEVLRFNGDPEIELELDPRKDLAQAADLQ